MPRFACHRRPANQGAAWSDDSSAVFFFNDTATTEIYTLSLHDALPISACGTHPTLTLRLLRRFGPSDGHLLMNAPRLSAVRGDDAPPAEALFGDLREDPTHRRAIWVVPFEHDLFADLARDEREHIAVERADVNDAPGVNRRIVETYGRAVIAHDVARLVTFLPARDDPHVLDGAPLKNPAEVPFSLLSLPRAVRAVHCEINVPVAGELTEEHHLVGEVRGGTFGGPALRD